nr:unnamed protein product [Callosobruchus analis]
MTKKLTGINSKDRVKFETKGLVKVFLHLQETFVVEQLDFIENSLDNVSDENLPDSDDSINDPNYDSDTESLSSKDASSPGRSIKKSRKRTRNPQNWNTNRQKQKVASGMEHKSKNKVIPAKTIAMPCTDSCRFQCTTNFNEDLRKSINSAFWNPDTDINHKRQFVASHVKKYC